MQQTEDGKQWPRIISVHASEVVVGDVLMAGGTVESIDKTQYEIAFHTKSGFRIPYTTNALLSIVSREWLATESGKSYIASWKSQGED